MKNINLTRIVLQCLVLSIFICSCNKDDDSNPNPNSNPGTGNNPPPVADFTYSGANVPAPATVSFTNTSTNANSYSWDFGDNGTSSNSNPIHTYTSGGVYTVTLTATGSGGTNTISKTVNIQNTPTTCKIISVQVTNMPFTDGSGVSWDTFDGPDVFFKIATTSGTVLFDATSSRYNNVTLSSLPIGWSLSTPFSITPLNSTRNILLYDYDTLDPDDYIGGVGFNPYTSVSGYPSTVTLSYQGVTIILGLQWQ